MRRKPTIKQRDGKTIPNSVDNGIPNSVTAVSENTPSSHSKSYTRDRYAKRKPDTIVTHEGSLVLDNKRIAQKATRPPHTSFIIYNKIVGFILIL